MRTKNIATLRKRVEKGRINGQHLTEEDSVDALADEYGLCQSLVRVVENVYWSLPEDAQAARFLVDFSTAIPEGANIKPSEVRDECSDLLVVGLEGSVSTDSAAEFLAWLRTRPVGSA